jgi:hypothetical protein
LHGHERHPIGSGAGDRADVPNLGRHFPACSVNPFDHPLPASLRGLAMEGRNSRVAGRGGTVDRRAFGNDQAHIGLGPTLVMSRHIFAGDAQR